MSLIDELSLRTSVDLRGLRSGFGQGERMIDNFADRARSRLESFQIPAPSLASPSGGGSGGTGPAMAQDLSAAFAPVVAQIRIGLQQAMAPMNGFAARFGVQFDVVGQALVKSITKADKAIRFTHFQTAVTNARTFLVNNLTEMEGRVGRFARGANTALGGIAIGSRLLNQFTQLRRVMSGRNELARLGGMAPTLNFDNSIRNTVKNVTNLKNVAQQATQTFKGLGSQIALALGVTAITYKAVDFLRDGIKGAAELNDTISSTKVVFGGSANAIIAEADRMAAAFGTSKNEYISAATDFGAVFQGMGKSEAEAASLGNQLAKLGMDMASFKGGATTNAEAFTALSAALRGENDPIERFRVFLNADAIEAEALASGLVRSKKEIDGNAKRMAAFSLILRQTTKAQGDLARTQSETNNQFRKLGGNTSNFGVSIGKAFLPAVDRGTALLATFSGAVIAAFDRNRPLIDGFVSRLAYGFDTIGAVATRLAPSFLAIGATIAGAFGGAGSAVTDFLPSLDSFVGLAESGLANVNTALKATIGFVRDLPSVMDSAFGSGTTSMIGSFISQAGLIAGVVTVAGAGVIAATTAFAGLFGVLSSGPVVIGSVGAGLAYVTATTFGLSDVIGTVGFGIRNFGALGEVALLKVGGFAENFVSILTTIPTMLADIGKYASTHWLDLLMMPFRTIVNTLRELSRAFDQFIKAPLNGITIDLDKVFAAQKQFADGAMAAITKPITVDVQSAVDQVYARIAKKEQEYQQQLAKRAAFTPPVPAGPPAIAPSTPQDAKPADVPNQKQAEKLGAFVDRIKDAIKTPMEKFQETMTQLGQARDSGRLTQAEYDKGAQYAQKEYRQDSKQKDTPQYAAANKLGSQEAYDQVLKAMGGGPMDEVVQVGRDQVDELKGLRSDLRGGPGAPGGPRPITPEQMQAAGQIGGQIGGMARDLGRRVDGILGANVVGPKPEPKADPMTEQLRALVSEIRRLAGRQPDLQVAKL